MSPLRLVAVLALPPATYAAVSACGPSFQAVYEGDVHFEHCYALDMGGSSPAAKRGCWSDWLGGYTFGESRDRVEYATERVRMLSGGAPLEANGGLVSTTQNGPLIAAPNPTSAFQSPPHLMEEDAGAPDAGPLPAAPGSDCVDACSAKFASCRRTCPDYACVACDRAYRSCVPGCFRADAGAQAAPRSRR